MKICELFKKNDLMKRFKKDKPLSQDFDLFYTADEKGYTDYPFYKID